MSLEGNPWFVAKDVCLVLGFAPSPNGGFNHHLSYHLDDTQRSTITKNDPKNLSMGPLFSGTASRVSLISESGLYTMVMKSRKPEAKPFQDWVTKEVLPSIRKTGSYVTATQ